MILDVIYLFILVYAFIKGITNGLILGIFSFLAFVIGLAAALKLSTLVTHYFDDGTGSTSKWLPVLSFFLVFVVVVLLVKLGAGIIQKTMKFAMLGWIDKIGGIFFYMVIFTIIFSVILFFAEKVSLVSPETIADSKVHDFIAPWGPKVIDNLGKIIPVFKGLFNDLQGFFERLGKPLTTGS